MDLIGPITPTSLGGAKYALIITDDYSRYSFIYFLKSKAETASRFKEFLSYIKNHTSYSIKSTRIDNGGEFIASSF